MNQLNKNDLMLLRMIKEFKGKGIKKEFKANVQKTKDKEEENKRIDTENEKIELENKSNRIKKMKLIKWSDRNIKIGEDTIFWKDFAEIYELISPELGFTLLYETVDDKGERSMEWAYLTRAFLKLERLGLIQMDYISTVGTINSLNIDRFHITLFGLKLLDYI